MRNPAGSSHRAALNEPQSEQQQWAGRMSARLALLTGMVKRMKTAGPRNMYLDWEGFDTPALLLDKNTLLNNILAMQHRAGRTKVRLRPHFKTHKCLQIAALQLEYGAVGITVAKLDEAAALIGCDGCNDVFVANEVVSPQKLSRAGRLAKVARLTIGVDSAEGIDALAAAARENGTRIGARVEIDSGLHRCGVLPQDAPSLAQKIAERSDLWFDGVFTHAGHAYGAADNCALRAISREEIDKCVASADAIQAQGIAVDCVSICSTPTMSVFEGHPRVTEIRPGNYVFMDGFQVNLGVSSLDQCALSLAATVISRPAQRRVVIDAGSKSLGLDKGAHGISRIDHFGTFANGGGRLIRLSEEHGVAEVPATSELGIGDRVQVLMNHACIAAHLGREFHILDDGRVVDRWLAGANMNGRQKSESKQCGG